MIPFDDGVPSKAELDRAALVLSKTVHFLSKHGNDIEARTRAELLAGISATLSEFNNVLAARVKSL